MARQWTVQPLAQADIEATFTMWPPERALGCIRI
jgi:hypothetical protein